MFDENSISLPLVLSTDSTASTSRDIDLEESENLKIKIDSHIHFNKLMGLSSEHPNMRNICRSMINKDMAERNLDNHSITYDDGLGSFDSEEEAPGEENDEEQRIGVVADLGDDDSLHLGDFNPIASSMVSVSSDGS